MMTIAIMQPYVFPYIGYFQLMNHVDEFVVYDNIQFTKKGWINRNRILVNGNDHMFSLSIKKDSDYLDVCDRVLADTWITDRQKLLNRIKESYKKSPFFKEVYPLVESALLYEKQNLFLFILNTINLIKEYLHIRTKIVISSTINIDHMLKSQAKVLAICKAKGTSTYINPIGGTALYNKSDFANAGIELLFLRAKEIYYKQFENEFVPWLSILDVIMFNSKEQVWGFLNQFLLE